MKDLDVLTLLPAIIPGDRIKSSLIDLVAYASDAGFYTLRPKVVVIAKSEQEIISLFKFSRQHQLPIVFRAAGTSLSGQAITDGILVDLSQYWSKITVLDHGASVRVQPGAIAAHVNARLKKYNTKIGPDPASISSAMMGGIISNNASGMCCGVINNSYHTVKYLRFILTNGNTYSTEDPQDYQRFNEECPDLSHQLLQLQHRIRSNPETLNKIRQKYKTKNTVGYGVNSFIDYAEPLDILAHLLIGGEGTLAFIAEAVLHTIPDLPLKSTSILYFDTIYSACEAIVPLIATGAAAVELMDRSALQSVANMKGVPEVIKTLPLNATALLVEYQGNEQALVEQQIETFMVISGGLSLLFPVAFTTDPFAQAALWKVRKGMFPAVGAVRASGTTVILEDISFPVEKLGHGILDLQELFKIYGYDQAIIFGHAKDGNIHFVITQSFNSEQEIKRYDQFLKAVVALVVIKYNGALKAEHGTGRNMAPFVETEWGAELYAVMASIKKIVDPTHLLNPGVIINANKHAHLNDLKALPTVEEEVDRCMECGFCEHRCPSRDITLTPRKRIVVRRELLNLKDRGERKAYRQLLKQYQYSGLDTCAVDGLCATACPVDINTGDLVKRLRRENHTAFGNYLALLTIRNFNAVNVLVKLMLSTGLKINRVFGKNSMISLTRLIRKLSPNFPLWSNQLALAKPTLNGKKHQFKNEVVYFPSCITRLMGSAGGEKSIPDSFLSISCKAQIDVIIPAQIKNLCCGQIYSSKGFAAAHAVAANMTIENLWEASKAGTLSIILDVSSCTQTLLNCRTVLTLENRTKFDQLQIIDSIEYMHDYILPNVKVVKKKKNIVLHPVCSIERMEGLQLKFENIANHFADKVTTPLFSGCCGMAGDRGFLFPELTRSATLLEAEETKSTNYDGYYSTSKTCEIAMSDAIGKNYQSIINLVDETT